MKSVSQTHFEADTPRVEFLKPKAKLRVGSWNVKYLYQAGMLQRVLREMESYNIELSCVSEARLDRLDKDNFVHGTDHSLL